MKEEEAGNSRRWNPVIVILVFVLMLGVVAAGIFTVRQFQERTMLREKEPQEVSFAAQMVEARLMVLACQSYAIDHEGKFPPALDVLYPDHLDVEGLFKTEDGEPRWHYVPGLTDDPANFKQVLLWSREPVGGKRWAVGYVSGSVVMKEREPGVGEEAEAALEEKLIERLRQMPATFLTMEKGELVAVNGHISFDDAGMAMLGWLEGIREISLTDSQVTDAGVKAMGNRDSLMRLSLWNTLITDDGVAYLLDYASIEHLDISNTAVTDRCINTLIEMEGLKSVGLAGTGVSEAGMTRLEKARPEVFIR